MESVERAVESSVVWCGIGSRSRGGTAVRTEEHEREGKEWSPAPGKGQGEWSELPLE